MKAYIEVKDIIQILNFNEISYVTIIDEEKDDIIERIKWGSQSCETMKKKEYMRYYPTMISVASGKELIIKCVSD